MNKTEIIFFAIAIIILLACISSMPEYYFILIFLLALAILLVLMTLLAKYKKRVENPTLSIISYVIGVILFVVYFINSVYMDLTNKGSTVDGTLILSLFILTMCIGWFFEKNKN